MDSDQAGLYPANNLTRWARMDLPVDTSRDGDDVLARLTSSGAQLVIRRPLLPERIQALLALPVTGRRTLLEDPFGVIGVRVPGSVLEMRRPVMVRPAGPLAFDRPAGVQVATATGPEHLALAERAMVDGFPRPDLQPWTAGALLPPRLLDVPGWRAWLGLRNGQAAAGAVSFDDGASVGVYSLATLPEHRGAGVASAILAAIVAAHPERPSVLVPTLAARSLYEKLGYVAVSEGCWYLRRG